jgi:DNA-binding transcriptional regulator YdaS (Cro superfamily)
MDLKTYLSEARGRLTALANDIGVYPPDVSRWVCGYRPIPVKYGAAIEKATNGLVTRQELFPESWHQYWPELAMQNTTP